MFGFRDTGSEMDGNRYLRHSIHGAIRGRLRDRPCFMFVGVNRVNVV